MINLQIFQRVAAIFMLMTGRTIPIYISVWDKLFEIVPELKNNVTNYMIDFEAAEITAAREKFPTAIITGCLWHLQKVNRLN